MTKRILIVEDNAQLRLVLRMVLEREGYDVREAEDGNVAIKEMAENPFDLVLMDIIMPNKEGIETLMDLRKKKSDVKVIAMSGGGRYHNFDPLKLAQDCGADFVISKPFEPSQIKELIARCWQETSARTQSL